MKTHPFQFRLGSRFNVSAGRRAGARGPHERRGNPALCGPSATIGRIVQRAVGLLAGAGRRNFPTLAAICLAAALIAGCATEVSQHVFLKQTYPAKPANYAVEIFTNGLPARSFERAAILDVHCEGQGFIDPTIDKAIPMFIKEARAAGCDAVIEIQEAKTPDNWTLETRVRHYTGTGVVYK